MSDDSANTSNRPEANCKVERLIEKYELTGMGEELEAYWNGSDGERFSLRELADHFNRNVLKTVMESAGMRPTDDDAEHVYTVLTDSDISTGSRVQKQRELERESVDIDELERDFVSHQAIHTYLREYRGAEYEREDERNQVEKGRETLQRLRSRTAKVTERTLDNLVSTSRISIGTFDVFVDVRVHCHDCDSDYDVADLLKRKTCDC